MTITDNLKNDISNAPTWFKESISIKPSEQSINDKDGKISYSKWVSKNDSTNLLILIHGTGAHKKWWDPIAPQFLNETNVIAVDPSFIPLGSRIYVPGYGEFVAGDTGGAINGNRIDIHHCATFRTG